ncbi:MAG: HAD family phosphatase [Comamonadaceae bacterium]|nr:MAG: HAD family phosphatase [Comamonadaceae bacterium]
MSAPPSALQAVLFDHDGTLVDSEPVHLLLWQQVLAPLGVTLDLVTYQAHHAGMPTPANAQALVQRFALNLSASQLADAKHEATVQWLAAQPFPLMPSAREVLHRLRAAGLKLAIVTGAEAAGAQRTLQGHGLQGFFDTVVSGDDVVRSKPAPEAYQLAMTRLGLPPEACVAVEDTETGVSAAVDAGLRVLAVPHALSAHQDLSRATERFDDLTQATNWLLKPVRPFC